MLGTLVDSLVGWAGAHRELAYGVGFAVALGEALPVIGAFVPGDAVLLGVSALVATGALRLVPLMLAAVLGAVIGDGLAFWLGHRYRSALLERSPLRAHPALIARGEAFLRRHGGKSVFIARFTPGVRAVVPLLAGMLSLPVGRFYAMNLLSALIWGPAHILLGALLGAALVLLGAIAGRLAFLAALLLALAAAGVFLARITVRRLPAVLARARAALWRHAALRRWLAGRFDSPPREHLAIAVLGLLLAGSLWLFFGVLQDVLAGDPLVRANTAVFHLLQSLRTDWADRVMVTLSELGDFTVVAAVSAAAILWLLSRRNGRAAGHVAAAVLFASAFTLLVKVTLQVPRPAGAGAGGADFAFPSGHSAVNAALYGVLVILAAEELTARATLLAASAAAVLPLAIAFSRLYLGAHWLSDVIAGLAFGTAWAALLGLSYHHGARAPLGAGGLCASVALALLGAGALHAREAHTRDLGRYAPREPVTVLSAAAWWQGRWRELPARRVDLAGSVEAPITLQWAGGAHALRARLAAAGWGLPPEWSLRSALEWLAPRVPITRLPVVPSLENGHAAVLVMVRAGAAFPARARLVLRVWRSQVRIGANPAAATPLLIGTVSEQRARRPVWFLTTTRTLPDYDAPRTVLAAALGAARLVHRAGQGAGSDWDGGVLLARAAAAGSFPGAAR